MTGNPSALRQRLQLRDAKSSIKEGPDAVFVNVNDLIANKYTTVDNRGNKFSSTLASKPNLVKTDDNMIDRLINNNCFSNDALRTAVNNSVERLATEGDDREKI